MYKSTQQSVSNNEINVKSDECGKGVELKHFRGLMDYFQRIGKSLGAVQTENPASMHLRTFIKHLVCNKFQVQELIGIGKLNHGVVL